MRCFGFLFRKERLANIKSESADRSVFRLRDLPYWGLKLIGPSHYEIKTSQTLLEPCELLDLIALYFMV